MVDEILEIAGVTQPKAQIWCQALPPGAMSVKELDALLHSERMEIFLDQDAYSILQLEKTERGYILTTEYQQVEIFLTYKSSGIGPQIPHFEWDEPIMLSETRGTIGNNIRLKEMIASGELFEKLGSADMVKLITFRDEGFRFQTLKGHKFTISHWE